MGYKVGRVNYDILWIEPYSTLKRLTRAYDDAIRSLNALIRYETSPTLSILFTPQRLQTIKETYMDFRKEVAERIEEVTEETLEWQRWGQYVPGLGKLSLGKMLGYIGNPAARLYHSSLALHCGVAPVGGQLPKRQKGERCVYNVNARKQLYILCSNFLRTYARVPNLYGEIYYTYRNIYAEKHPDWTKAHIHYAALIKVCNIFVSHLWEISRRAQGLDVPKPYVFAHRNHVLYFPPSLAVHPRKYRWDVAEAIAEVSRLLPEETDEILKKHVQELLTRLSNA